MGTCATPKKSLRRFANGGALDSLLGINQQEPRQPVNPLQNQLNALDQKIAMGNAMDGLSNTERYQLANPTNAAYKPGSMMGGTSADASMQRQQTSILQNLRSGIAAQMPDTQQSKWVGGGTESSIPSIGDAFQIGQPRRFADGGIVGLLKNRKKAIDDAVNGAESPNAIVQANPPSAGVKPSMGSQADNYAAEAAKLEAEQLAAAKARFTQPKKKGFFGFANGGKIQGPGTPTSDSIAARVRQTGEPIQVSTGERIVSAAQEKVLQKIASGLGFDSLDALLEAGTGKPVGPTIKGGKLAAASGMSVADMEAKKKPWLAPVVNTLGAGIDWVGDVANKVVNGPERKPQVEQQSAANPNPLTSARADRELSMRGDAPLSGAVVAPSVQQAAQATGVSARDLNSPDQNLANVSIASGAIPKPGSGIASMRGIDGRMKNIAVDQPTYTDTAGNPTNDWTKTDRYAQAMQVNESMKRAANQMERNRYARDMQADITNPKVIALAKLNLDRMNQEDQAQQQAISGGLDNRVKQNQLLKSDQEAQMIARLNDPNLTPEQRLSMRSDLLAMQGKNPNEHRFIKGDNVKVYNDMGQVIGEQQGGFFDTATMQPVGQPQRPVTTKEEVDKAIASGKITKEQAAARIKAAGGNPKDYGL